jgi:tyrosyl-tRNA synthetase
MNIDEQVNLIMQGSEFNDTILADNMRIELKGRLIESCKTKIPLRVYAGYDATAPDIHLGHTITLRKLRIFQDMGHHVIFLIGNFTSLVGDTSDKKTGRPRKTKEEVEAASKTYAQQALKILDPGKTEVVYNANWLSKLNMQDVIDLSSNFTVQQFLARDNYKIRIENNNPVGLHEFLYALLQGYDAVYLKADIQIGATEQLFNIMAGRKLQAAYGQRGCTCITYPILIGTDGVERMSKSKGNYIGISENPDSQYIKVMRLSDDTMIHFVKLVTRWSPKKINEIITGLKKGNLHPMDVKKQLAFEIVSSFHGDEKASLSEKIFETHSQQRKIPDEINNYAISGKINVIDLLVNCGFAASKSEGRRLVTGKGVKIDGRLVESIDTMIEGNGGLLQAGKHKFLRMVRKNVSN